MHNTGLVCKRSSSCSYVDVLMWRWLWWCVDALLCLTDKTSSMRVVIRDKQSSFKTCRSFRRLCGKNRSIWAAGRRAFNGAMSFAGLAHISKEFRCGKQNTVVCAANSICYSLRGNKSSRFGFFVFSPILKFSLHGKQNGFAFTLRSEFAVGDVFRVFWKYALESWLTCTWLSVK